MKKFLLLAFLFVSVLAAKGDLKSWLHGAPAAATPGKPDAAPATVTFAAGVAPDKPIADFFSAFAAAMQIHDGKALKPLLSEKFVVAGTPDEHNPVDFFMQAMVQIKAPNEMMVNAIEPEGDERVVKVEFRSTDRPTKMRSFRFDSAGKLISADFFSLQTQGHSLFGH